MYGKGLVEFKGNESVQETHPTSHVQKTSTPQTELVAAREERGNIVPLKDPKQKEAPKAAVQFKSSESPPKKTHPTPSKPPRRITVRTLRRMKEQQEKIVMLTAYDATFARLLDQSGVEMLLVGDSLGMVVQGADDTLSVSLEDMIYHTRCVARGASRAMVVGDLPFMSYQLSPEQALQSAGRLVKEGGAQAVKLEGGADVAEAIFRICRAGIPVVGHLGLTPQSVHAFGGFVVQGRESAHAERIVQDALALQEAGACSIVLECIPAPLAQQISSMLDIPTIGIGAGEGCDGQVLVVNDMLGVNPDFQPRFVKQYTNLHDLITHAVGEYLQEVKASTFPTKEHSFF